MGLGVTPEFGKSENPEVKGKQKMDLFVSD